MLMSSVMTSALCAGVCECLNASSSDDLLVRRPVIAGAEGLDLEKNISWQTTFSACVVEEHLF